MTLEIPRPKYARRVFYFTTMGVCVLLVIVQFVIVPLASSARPPSAAAVAGSLSGALFTSIVSGVVIATILLWLTPEKDEKNQPIEVIAAYERKEVHERSRSDTNIWWYVGAIGRYNRAIAFPDLARRARLENASKNIVLLLIDPDNIDTCERYARWRNGLRSTSGSEGWDATRVRRELLATILCAYSWSAQESFLEITVGLKNEWSLLRVDMSSRLAIVTAEDAQYPALKCRSDGFYYNILREDFRLGLAQARQLPKSVAAVPLKELNSENAQKIFGELSLRLDGLSPSDVGEIVRIAKKPENPYG
ncbi:hypothetical protein AB0C38_13770 [Amycolatopsis sp. NPDC048633]|uniref:hypothetical protein n=1 Tax=Amycolatopsis sp. NPDC048633 TaxID=3157095 RepID=UPI0033F2E9C5